QGIGHGARAVGAARHRGRCLPARRGAGHSGCPGRNLHHRVLLRRHHGAGTNADPARDAARHAGPRRQHERVGHLPRPDTRARRLGHPRGSARRPAGVLPLRGVVGRARRQRPDVPAQIGSTKPQASGMNGLLQDLRFAVRSFGLNPGFTVAALLSIAIGVGANSSIFSVASALLLRPLPYPDADRLAILWSRSPGLGIAEDWFSTAQYFDIKRGHRGFEEVAIAIGGNYNLTGDGEPERIGTVRVSSNLLPMLGARAALGRLFTAEEDLAGGAGAAILNHGTWMRRYGGNPDAVGRSITLNGQRFQIVGVLTPSFSLPREVLPTLGGAENAEILLHLPLAADAATARNREDYNVIAKLKRGVGVGEAQAAMDAITARLRREHPDFYPPNGGLTFDIVPLQEQVVGDVRRSLLLLVAAVGIVLLV